MKIIYYLIENKEWIFSGLGIVILGWVGNLLFKKKTSNISYTQQSGDNSTNIQGTNVTYNDPGNRGDK